MSYPHSPGRPIKSRGGPPGPPPTLQQKPQAQWGLFREDVRDVFSLSQSNMDNYILVGALIVSWLREKI